jgi:hypothetical protein
MMIVLQTLQTLVVDHSVLTMNICMDLNAVSATAITKKLQVHKHVRGIRSNGKHIFNIIIGIPLLELEECYKDPMNTCLGNQLDKQINNLMMNLLHLKYKERIIFLQATSIV